MTIYGKKLFIGIGVLLALLTFASAVNAQDLGRKPHIYDNWSMPKVIAEGVGGNTYDGNIVWDGSGYGLVWNTYVGDNSNSASVYFARLDINGNTISNPLLIGHGGMPAVSWDGKHFGIVWSSIITGDNSAIFFTSLNKSGKKVINDMQVSQTCGAINPDIVWNGNEYGIVWEGNPCLGKLGIYFTTVSDNGLKTRNDTLVQELSGGNSAHAKIRWNGSSYAIVSVYFQFLNNFQNLSDIYLSIVNTQLDTVDNKKLTNAQAFTNYHDPVITVGGNQYGILWNDNFTTYFTRTTLQGDIIGTTQGIDSFGGGHSGIAWNGTNFGLVISRVMDSNIRVIFTEYDSSGNLITTGKEISASAGIFISPLIIFNGKYYVSIWKDGDNNTLLLSHQTL